MFLIDDGGQCLGIDVVAKTILDVDKDVLHLALLNDVTFAVILGREAAARVLRHVNGLPFGCAPREGDGAIDGGGLRKVYFRSRAFAFGRGWRVVLRTTKQQRNEDQAQERSHLIAATVSALGS